MRLESKLWKAFWVVSLFESKFCKAFWVVSPFQWKFWKIIWVLSRFKSNSRKPIRTVSWFESVHGKSLWAMSWNQNFLRLSWSELNRNWAIPMSGRLILTLDGVSSFCKRRASSQLPWPSWKSHRMFEIVTGLTGMPDGADSGTVNDSERLARGWGVRHGNGSRKGVGSSFIW